MARIAILICFSIIITQVTFAYTRCEVDVEVKEDEQPEECRNLSPEDLQAWQEENDSFSDFYSHLEMVEANGQEPDGVTIPEKQWELRHNLYEKYLIPMFNCTEKLNETLRAHVDCMKALRNDMKITVDELQVSLSIATASTTSTP